MSLGHLATQFATASKALASVPPDTESRHQESLETIRRAQGKLEQDLESLKEQVAHLREYGTRTEKEKERALDLASMEGFGVRLQSVEKKLDEIEETMRLE